MHARICLALGATLGLLAADPPTEALKRIAQVRNEGVGNATAATAWKELVALGPAALVPVLNAFDDDEPLAANWLQTAADAIAENAGDKLDPTMLEAFVRDRKHPAIGRAVAYRWLARLQPDRAAKLLAGLTDDPSAELRRDAIAARLTGKPEQAELRALFEAARDLDQVQDIAKLLDTPQTKPNVTKHLGFLPGWRLLGPLDAPKTDRYGYTVAYPPETKVDTDATVPGKDGKPLAWKAYTTPDTLGDVDLNKVIGSAKAAVAYAYTTVQSPRAQRVWLRAGSNNALKVFVNGKPVLAREVFHNGNRPDMYIVPVQLNAGKNAILVKVCQNDQAETWAQKWSFQLRLCDRIGGPIPLTEEGK